MAVKFPHVSFSSVEAAMLAYYLHWLECEPSLGILKGAATLPIYDIDPRPNLSTARKKLGFASTRVPTVEELMVAVSDHIHERWCKELSVYANTLLRHEKGGAIVVAEINRKLLVWKPTCKQSEQESAIFSFLDRAKRMAMSGEPRCKISPRRFTELREIEQEMGVPEHIQTAALLAHNAAWTLCFDRGDSINVADVSGYLASIIMLGDFGYRVDLLLRQYGWSMWEALVA